MSNFDFYLDFYQMKADVEYLMKGQRNRLSAFTNEELIDIIQDSIEPDLYLEIKKELRSRD